MTTKSIAGAAVLVAAAALVPAGVTAAQHARTGTATSAASATSMTSTAPAEQQTGARWSGRSRAQWPASGTDQSGAGQNGVDPGGSGWGLSGRGTRRSTSQTPTVTGTPVSSAKGVVLVDTQLPGGSGAGTGITLTSDGTVLTNYHVVEGSTSIRVTDTTSGRTFTATVVGHDATHDIAMLRLAGASGLSTAVLNPTMPSLGSAVTAVGQGGGQGVLYAAKGSITATDQAITAGDEADPSSSERLTGLLETSADVVPGYSGGPLLDAAGRVVGIDTAASGGANPTGYAVPIAQASAIATQIEKGQRTSDVHIGPRAGLGVSISSSAQVGSVAAGSAAAHAGIGQGSVITSIDGTRVSSAADLTGVLGRAYPGSTVRVGWTDAAGAQHTATVTLGRSAAN